MWRVADMKLTFCSLDEMELDDPSTVPIVTCNDNEESVLLSASALKGSIACAAKGKEAAEEDQVHRC